MVQMKVRWMSRAAALWLCLLLTFCSVLPHQANAAAVTVTNAIQFKAADGTAIHAHGGGMIKVGSYYYWYGENRNPNGTFKAVSMYRSTDLKNWEFRSNILTSASAAELNISNIERPKLLYNQATGQYVLWMHKENGSDYGEARVAVASSPTVDGNYSYHGSFRPLGYDSRDMTVYNDNGTAYLISATKVNADLNIYKLTPDFLGVESLVQTLWPGAYREAPALFKRGSVYFLVTSGATGWNPNQAKYATASSISGPWSALANFADSTTYGSQSAYVIPVEGTQSTTYLYMGDRWAGAWSGPVIDSKYVWLPLRFPSNTTLAMDFSHSLSIDAAAGIVQGLPHSWEPNAVYKLISRKSGKALIVENGSATNGAALEQWNENTAGSPHWQLVDAGGGYYKLKNVLTGKIAGVSNGATTDGTAIVQWTDGNWTSQHWQPIHVGGGYYKLKNRATGKLIDISDASLSDGANAIQWTDNGGTNQQFQIVKSE
ncbi:RICIN domain-containing protein [Paenibacillus mucilaginosus]|uniref:Beta-xylosidase n=1 Tax=Paenibacillus mucilaginosus (strain KNP414) TaxID=1036673 RepID=F8FQU9_PAEMK|nr:RICIN domain-containing protein [Paenibacillus mucilaginosus]AEI39279.1 beta-xylosidase [Paenibacillus mucilaginosus KNP414]MCG7217012.1 RICIN domain-containing protein [Paenibacillus mucilaginosus]WDM28280.1 RICIN domain-containing protein [Paenibacillus mucilaginosus]